MIADVALRWVVTVLFGLSAAECLYSLRGHRGWVSGVGHVLHVVMSIAMLVMAWPIGMGLPTRSPMLFFAVATVWFIAIAAVSKDPAARLGNQYHAVMMGAMAWMYAAMDSALLSGGASDGATASPASMPGMDMSAGASSAQPTEPQWISTINWALTIGFAVAAVYWLYRYRAKRAADPGPRTATLAHAGTLAQSFMAAGMAVMFGVML